MAHPPTAADTGSRAAHVPGAAPSRLLELLLPGLTLALRLRGTAALVAWRALLRLLPRAQPWRVRRAALAFKGSQPMGGWLEAVAGGSEELQVELEPAWDIADRH